MNVIEKDPVGDAGAWLDGLVELSRLYGSNPEFVLAGGGNTSVKIGDRLHVKASGQALATIDESGFVEMSRPDLQRLLESTLSAERDAREREFKDGVLAARLIPAKGQRPSVEAVLHHMVPGRYVVHTHATLVNVFSCSINGRRLIQESLGDAVLWIDAVDPGFLLAKTLERALAEYREATGHNHPRAIVLQNHGLVISGDTADEVAEHTGWLMASLQRVLEAHRIPAGASLPPPVDSPERRALIQTIAPALRGLLGTPQALKVVIFDDSPVIWRLVSAPGGQALAAGGPLNPDQIVYCKSYPLWFTPNDQEDPEQAAHRLRAEVEAYHKRYRLLPNVIAVEGLGLFASGDSWADANTVRLVYTDSIKLMLGAQSIGGVHYLSDDLRTFIEDWEVEAYRRQIAAAKPSGGRASGKIALVTGAAQGFGLEIAQDIAANGGHVVLADVNVAGATAAADGLVKRYGAGRALGLAVNVTDGASVSDALYRLVCNYGGLDVLISNAGVLRAASVKTQAEADFDFSTAVNYRGYFLCVQKTAPILAIQHLVRPDYWSDIIQINSKSGLVGSNKNAAYAGSKFGGIGLTQSFALELVDDGIKVNSICPGNFLDGPLWSDPENGLFVQYLRTGKVPGAKTVADVRHFYESKVPMARGCTTPDVMKAIYYLIEQAYETGQALPVTGGQVMLH